MTWFPFFGAGFLAGWWMCAVTWPISDRRPQPPSLKVQLLQKLDHISDVADKYQNTQDAISDLRRALEQLND